MRDFLGQLERVRSAMERREVVKALRRAVLKEARNERKAVAADLGSAVPALGNRVDRAVTVRQPRTTKGDGATTLGWRVGVVCRGRNAMVMTGRGGFQPLLPLPYWYEHGFAGSRHTKGGLRAPHPTGPSSARSGAGVTERRSRDVEGIDERVFQTAAQLVERLFEKGL